MYGCVYVCVCDDDEVAFISYKGQVYLLVCVCARPCAHGCACACPPPRVHRHMLRVYSEEQSDPVANIAVVACCSLC